MLLPNLPLSNFTNYTESAYGSLLVTNNYGIVGGADAELDDNYRYRIQLKLQAQNGANEAALRFQILQIPGIRMWSSRRRPDIHLLCLRNCLGWFGGAAAKCAAGHQ